MADWTYIEYMEQIIYSQSLKQTQFIFSTDNLSEGTINKLIRWAEADGYRTEIHPGLLVVIF